MSQGADAEAQELAKATQNPLANLISLPFQNNTNFDFGPLEKSQNILNIQPVWPVELNDDWNFITRTILPIISQPGVVPGQSRKNGIGDTTFSGFFSPKKPTSGGMIWGAGPVILLPTATDDRLGSDQWGVGPSVVLIKMPGQWVIGSLFSQVWSMGGSGGEEVSVFTWQPFINYNRPNGSYFTTAPLITANWNASSSDTWTIPLGGGMGKIFKIGKRPVNGQISAYYNVEKPDFGADWQLRIQLQLLFPKGKK